MLSFSKGTKFSECRNKSWQSR